MRWLDRALLISPFYYGLCLSEKDFQKELKGLKIPRSEWPSFLGSPHANATLHTFEKGDGILCAIITLGSMKGRSLAQVHAMLVHEAVHLWQAIRENIGEHRPSAEFEAYSVQTISQRLIESYDEAKKGKKK